MCGPFGVFAAAFGERHVFVQDGLSKSKTLMRRRIGAQKNALVRAQIAPQLRVDIGVKLVIVEERACAAADGGVNGMKFTRVIARIVTVAALAAPAGAGAEDIALSLVNPKGRIDIPVGAVEQIIARANFVYRIQGTEEMHETPSPHVQVCFSKDIGERICELTGKIVGQPLAIVVDCETLTKPIVRHPLCENPCFEISANDFAEANALVQRIRKGTNRACAPSG
jgi:SecDF, P1 head subdomain